MTSCLFTKLCDVIIILLFHSYYIIGGEKNKYRYQKYYIENAVHEKRNPELRTYLLGTQRVECGIVNCQKRKK